jgi:GNAT superfamily N-acetyltransferase
MLHITRDTWGGNDYLPYVWNGWLHDTRGILMAAEMEGRMVGLQHVALMPDGTAWLEGIRVDPEAQGKGVGTALLDAGIEWARFMDCRAARLSTSSQNDASNRMAVSRGFDRVCSFKTAELSEPVGSPSEVVRIGLPSDNGAVGQFLRTKGIRYYTEGWTAYELAPERTALLLAMGSIALVGRDAVDALAIATFNGKRPLLRLGLLEGSQDGMETLARWLAHRAAGVPSGPVRGQVEPDRGALHALAEAGYRTDFEHTMFLYELPLPSRRRLAGFTASSRQPTR